MLRNREKLKLWSSAFQTISLNNSWGKFRTALSAWFAEWSFLCFVNAFDNGLVTGNYFIATLSKYCSVVSSAIVKLYAPTKGWIEDVGRVHASFWKSCSHIWPISLMHISLFKLSNNYGFSLLSHDCLFCETLIFHQCVSCVNMINENASLSPQPSGTTERRRGRSSTVESYVFVEVR